MTPYYRALRWELLDWQRAQRKLEYEEFDDKTDAFLIDEIDLPKILEKLGAEERSVVELFYLCDLSVYETAITLAIPEGTVKSRLSRARKMLADLFELPE